ncbi:MAG TPA: hypothetical protein VGK00_03130 [Anaerolineales bacterium]|jgi:hypothetical protein
MNNNRTVGIVATILTTLCCACPGLFLCGFGAFIAAGQPITTTLNGVESQQVYPAGYGITMLCLALVLFAIPFVVGFFTLRKKPAPEVLPVTPNIGGPIPPAS